MSTHRSQFPYTQFLPSRGHAAAICARAMPGHRARTATIARTGAWAIQHLVFLGMIVLPGLWASETTNQHDEFLIGVGAARILSSHPLAVTSADYRFARNWCGFHSYVTADWASGGAYYIGAGVLYNWEITRHWRLTIDSGPGYYDRHHSSRDLGASMEFYSNIELSRSLGRGQRLGLSFGHISNGGLSNQNPGSESLRLLYSIQVK